MRTLTNCGRIQYEYVTLYYMDWEPPQDRYEVRWLREQTCGS